MVETNFNRPNIDIFNPALNKNNRATQEWDEAYDRLDNQGQLSTSEIRDRIGSRPDEVVIARPERSNLYVDIEARAVALEGIIEYLNKANQVQGALTYTENGGRSMRRRYGEDLEEVLTGAEQNRDKLFHAFKKGTETLAATDALRAYGYDDYAVDAYRVSMQSEINQQLGVGRAYADKRNRVARDARRLADVVAGRKKPRQ